MVLYEPTCHMAHVNMVQTEAIVVIKKINSNNEEFEIKPNHKTCSHFKYP